MKIAPHLGGAAALAFVCLAPGLSRADTDVSRPAPTETPSASPETAPQAASSGAMSKSLRRPSATVALGPVGIVSQTPHVRRNCFPGKLTAILHDISSHFGRPVIVTSGLRTGGRRGSFHRTCKAADFQIAGVAPSVITRYARGLSGVGGVGAYSHTRSVHVDIGDRVFSWYGGRRRSAALSPGCCPACAMAEAGRSGAPRFSCSA